MTAWAGCFRVFLALILALPVNSQTLPLLGVGVVKSGGGGGAITLIAHTALGCPGGCGSSFSTSAINTTGANFIIVAISGFGTGTTNTISDSASNSWTALNMYVDANSSIQMFYCAPTCSTSSSHTFTQSTPQAQAIAVAAFSNVAASPFDVQTGNNTGSSGVTVTTGSMTTTAADLVIAACELDGASGAATVDSGFTVTDSVSWVSGVSFGVAMAYLVQSSAGAINPTWTMAAGGADGHASQAAFK